jgi:phosphoenolpyruvate carboxylase
LLEMVFAKGDPGIAAVYDKLLVTDDLQPFGEKLRKNYEDTKELLLQVLYSDSLYFSVQHFLRLSYFLSLYKYM